MGKTTLKNISATPVSTHINKVIQGSEVSLSKKTEKSPLA